MYQKYRNSEQSQLHSLIVELKETLVDGMKERNGRTLKDKTEVFGTDYEHDLSNMPIVSHIYIVIKIPFSCLSW